MAMLPPQIFDRGPFEGARNPMSFCRRGSCARQRPWK